MDIDAIKTAAKDFVATHGAAIAAFFVGFAFGALVF